MSRWRVAVCSRLREAGPHPKKPAVRPAQSGESWRRGPESNRAIRICNPVHNRFATAPWLSSVRAPGRPRNHLDDRKKKEALSFRFF